MKTHCPSCNTEMEEFESRCPTCLRERTRAEIFSAGKPPAASAAAAASQGRFGGLSWIFVGVGAVAFAFYMVSEKKLQEADIAAQKEIAEVEAETAGDESISITIITPDSRPAPDTAKTVEAPLPEDAPSTWLFRGEVYDLMRLTPVRGARLTFEDRISRKLFRTKSDSKGRYKIRLPKTDRGGYVLTIRHRNYDGIYLEDLSPPYKQRDEDNRLETLQSVSQSTILHVPLLPEKSEDEIQHDLVLLPP